MALISQIGCGNITGGMIDINSEKTPLRTVTAKKSQIDGVLGIEVDKNSMLNILNNLGIKICI
jgi:phenylalanyl-tRNA synthetase beta subunit